MMRSRWLTQCDILNITSTESDILINIIFGWCWPVSGPPLRSKTYDSLKEKQPEWYPRFTCAISLFLPNQRNLIFGNAKRLSNKGTKLTFCQHYCGVHFINCVQNPLITILGFGNQPYFTTNIWLCTTHDQMKLRIVKCNNSHHAPASELRSDRKLFISALRWL